MGTGVFSSLVLAIFPSFYREVNIEKLVNEG